MIKRIGRWLLAAALLIASLLMLPLALVDLYAHRWDIAIGLVVFAVIGGAASWLNSPPRGWTLRPPLDDNGNPVIPPPAGERRPPPY